MTSRRCRGNHRVDAPLYIKQREPAGAQKKNSCQFILTVPLFYVARRPRPASSLRTIVSKPVAPFLGGRWDSLKSRPFVSAIRAMPVEGESSFWCRKRQRPVKVRGSRPRHKSVVEKSTTEGAQS